MAWGYDWVSRIASGGLWQEWAFAAERFLSTGPIADPVLDMGCGTGHLVIRLTIRGHRVYGLDRSPRMLKAAGKRFGQAGLNRRLLQGRAQALPFLDSTLGTVITAFPAPYVTEPATQQEIVRVLRPGGRWIWVDAPFEPHPTPRMRIYAAVSTLAQLKSSVFRCETEGSQCRRKDALRFSERNFKWRPQIDPAPEFSLAVHQIAVRSTVVHAAVMEKKIPCP